MLGDAPLTAFVPVRDTAIARTFYEHTLGLNVVEETPFAVAIDAHGTLLRLTPVPDLTVQPFTIAGWQVPDITPIVRGLADRGVHFLRYDHMEQDELGIWSAPSGDRVAWFHDPDENTLSLTMVNMR
jgi:catechol 2,3-dioxygenase-like lactoylglutathione lyase family enzyme